MNIKTEISSGEFFDKITILEIKSERIKDPAKLANVHHELDTLNALLETQDFSRETIQSQFDELKTVNEKLWGIEDDIREKESKKEFDDAFIQLARAVYITNDRRSVIKRDINLALGSSLIEEKSYEDYS